MFKQITPLTEHKLWLSDFWKEFGRGGCRSNESNKNKTKTIKGLLRLSKVIIDRAFDLKRNRLKFNSKHKKKRWFKNAFKPCFACHQTKFVVRHHIIWLSHGGLNVRKNIVGLCTDCHALIHPWLKKKEKKTKTPLAIKFSNNLDVLFK